MRRFLIQRLLKTLPVIISVVTLVFLLIHFMPGDPIETMMGDNTGDVDRARIRELLGLNHSLPVQYLIFWKNIFWGGWGSSFSQPGRTVLSLILECFPFTLWLALCSLALALVISLPLGTLAACRPGTLIDKFSTSFSLLGMSVPIFVIAPLATLLFSIRLRWFPVSGSGSVGHLVLPTLCLGWSLSAFLTRVFRSSMLENLQEDFVRTARSKGLHEISVLFRHTLANALIPTLTILGNMLGSLLAGAVLTETLFDWPGVGNLFYKAFQMRDYPLVQGITLWIAIVYVVISLLMDLAYSWVDPRIRLSEAASV